MINTIIDKFTQRITVKLTRTVRKVAIILFVLSACLLLTLKSYIFTGILFVLLVGECAYITVILKKKILTIYSAVGVSLILCGHVSLFFNVSLYSSQKMNECFDPILLAVILLVEVLCLITGFFYTRRCVRKGTVRKPQAAVSTSLAFVLPGVLSYFLSTYIINEASVQIQNVFFTLVFAMGCSMVMFAIGMVHIAVIYYIKKYNIADRELSVEA